MHNQGNHMKYILVVDDDMDIGNLLEELLHQEGYGVLRAYSGSEALLLLEKRRPDLILLDLMLPGLSGEELLPKLRGIPVIVVSAKVDVTDKVRLLLDGAADYITKPFATEELLARVAVQLRKKETLQTRLRAGEMELDRQQRQVWVKDEPLHLTKTEYAILRLLMENAGQVLTKAQILDHISADTPDCVESSLKVHVSNLRKKLREAGAGDVIEAVWGIGFRLEA